MMEALTFPRYSPDDIVAYLRSHVLVGAEARNLTKADLFATLKVREGSWRAVGLRCAPHDQKAPCYGTAIFTTRAACCSLSCNLRH